MHLTSLGRGLRLGAALAGLMVLAAPALAQQSGQQQWFVPGQGGGGQPRPVQPAQAQPRPAAPPTAQAPAGQAPAAQAPAAPAAEAPPPIAMPQLPPIASSPPPPAPIIGVLDVEQIRARWTPYAQLDNAIRARVNRLRQDEQRERQALDEATRAFVAQRAQMNQDQQRARQREIENKAAELSRQFGERQREVQNLAQNAESLDQIFRLVVSQVAQARGLNLILRSNLVVLNLPALDVTNDVVAQLQLIPVQVQIPPELPPEAPPRPPQQPPAQPQRR